MIDPAPTLVSIHVAKARRLPMQARERVEVEAGKGIVGDRYHGAKHRHVTVQSREALDQAAAVLGRDVASELTRRNLTISHGAVPTEPGTRLRIGHVLLEVVRVAAPCRLLDDWIGTGAQEALRRRGGSVFRVLEGGTIALGDPVQVEAMETKGGGSGTPVPTDRRPRHSMRAGGMEKRLSG